MFVLLFLILLGGRLGFLFVIFSFFLFFFFLRKTYTDMKFSLRIFFAAPHRFCIIVISAHS